MTASGRPVNRARLLYAAAVALMAALLAALWWAPGPPAAWRHWQAPPPQAPQLDDVQAALLRANPVAAANDPVVLQQPLFSPTRRPQAARAVASGAAPAPGGIEQATLQGVVVGAALTGVMLQEGSETRFVRVGETVGDWTLVRVQGRQAVFARRGQERTLDWPTPTDTAAAPQAGAAKPAGAGPLNRPSPAPVAAPVAAPAAVPARAPTASPQATPSAPATQPAPAKPQLGAFGGTRAAPPANAASPAGAAK